MLNIYYYNTPVPYLLAKNSILRFTTNLFVTMIFIHDEKVYTPSHYILAVTCKHADAAFKRVHTLL